MPDTPEGIRYRVQRLEEDVRELEQRVQEHDFGVLNERLTNVIRRMTALEEEVGSLRKAIIVAALSVTTGTVIFALTIFVTLGPV